MFLRGGNLVDASFRRVLWVGLVLRRLLVLMTCFLWMMSLMRRPRVTFLRWVVRWRRGRGRRGVGVSVGVGGRGGRS